MAAHNVSREIVELTAGQQRQLAELLTLIEADEHAPTSVRAPERAAQVHLADSLSALELEPVRAASRIVDIGSGAGFPGLALAVALPSAEVALVESHRRRCDFLERARAAAAVENARVVWERAEEWGEGLGRNDVALARALAAQTVVLEYAAPLLRAGGTLVDWRGRRVREQEQAAERAAAALGLRRVEVHRVTPFPGASDHHLHVFVKERETPSRFPRRPGVARKRPLGG
jgi:16S rRNA (guanine527-N7)-methyltransferase